MRARFFVIAASIAALAYACGGADPVVIDGDAGESGNDASTGRRDAGGKDASLSDASRGDDGSVGSDSGSGDSGSSDAGRDAGSDAGVHPHRDGGIVPCGDVDDAGLTCGDSDPVCCGIQWDIFLNTAPDTFTCTTSAGDCTSLDAGGSVNVAIACRDESYCPGDKVCCGHIMSDSITSYYASVDCQSTCPLTDDAGVVNTDFRRFCDPAGADECSASGQTCGPSTILPGFNICQ